MPDGLGSDDTYFLTRNRKSGGEAPTLLGETGETLRQSLLALFSERKRETEVLRENVLDLLSPKPKRRHAEAIVPSAEQPATIPVEPGVYRMLRDINSVQSLIRAVQTLMAQRPLYALENRQRVFAIFKPHIKYLAELGCGENILYDTMIDTCFSPGDPDLIDGIDAVITHRDVGKKFHGFFPELGSQRGVILTVIRAITGGFLRSEEKEHIKRWIHPLTNIAIEERTYDGIARITTLLIEKGILAREEISEVFHATPGRRWAEKRQVTEAELTEILEQFGIPEQG